MSKLTDFLDQNFPEELELHGDYETLIIALLSERLPQKKEVATTAVIFSATALYNHGLGETTMELPEFSATSMQEAQKEAEKLANEKLGDGKWIEVRARPVGPVPK